MKTEVIQNQYDGPKPPEKRLPAGRFNLDYANSDNPEEIDQGIRETIKGIRLSILAMGIGLAKIKEQRLFVDLRYHSMAKYIEALCEDTQMERSGVFNWLYIGEAYLKYRKDLDKIGFSDEDGPTKLPYVEKALALYQKKDVFKAVKEMSLRQFVSFSRGDTPAPPAESDIRVKGNQVLIEGPAGRDAGCGRRRADLHRKRHGQHGHDRRRHRRNSDYKGSIGRIRQRCCGIGDRQHGEIYKRCSILWRRQGSNGRRL